MIKHANSRSTHALAAYLQRQNIRFGWHRYGIEMLNGMTFGLFSSLIIGLILKNIGTWAQLSSLIEIGTQAQNATGAAIGVGVAYGLKAPPLVLFASAAVGLVGASSGGVVGAMIATIIACECGKLIHKITPIDIVATPAVTLISGMSAAFVISPVISELMGAAGALIGWAMGLSPIVMSIVIAVVMGILLTLPISSAAIAISLGLSGVAAGAATVGCAAQMVGFAVMSYRDNGISGLVAQGLGTSMLQMPNILKNPKVWLPPTLSGAILAPFATVLFGMSNVPAGAGMGTSGLVGQIGTVEAMGYSPVVLGLIVAFHIVLPALLTLLIAGLMRSKGWIRQGDLTLPK